MNPAPVVKRLRARQLLLGAVLTLSTLFFASAAMPASGQRLVLTPTRAADAALFKGLTQVVIEPPFEASSVKLTINDVEIATKTRAPFVFDVDFGAEFVERTLAVAARAGKKNADWRTTINPGHKPLTVKLQHIDGGVEAKTTHSVADPIVAVDFYDGSAKIGSVAHAPYRLRLERPTEVIVATARTRSGAEVVDTMVNGDSVHAANYDVRTVPIFVSVTDQSGNSRVDLTQRDFRVFDKGRETKVLEFGKAFDQPVNIALLLDASTSMTYRMREASDAAARFIKSLQKQKDKFALFTIRSVPRRDVPLTSDLTSLQKALSTLEASGETALFDSVASAIRELREQRGRRAIVVLSDGDDTASNRTYDEVLQEAKLAAIPIYFIVFSETMEPTRSEDALRLIAAETGGFVAHANPEKLEERYRAIANDLRAQYAIKYQVTDSTQTGEWRPVKVVVSSPKLSARTIRGYFAP